MFGHTNASNPSRHTPRSNHRRPPTLSRRCSCSSGGQVTLPPTFIRREREAVHLGESSEAVGIAAPADPACGALLGDCIGGGGAGHSPAAHGGGEVGGGEPGGGGGVNRSGFAGG